MIIRFETADTAACLAQSDLQERSRPVKALYKESQLMVYEVVA
jgi:hypothetical protein